MTFDWPGGVRKFEISMEDRRLVEWAIDDHDRDMAAKGYRRINIRRSLDWDCRVSVGLWYSPEGGPATYEEYEALYRADQGGEAA